MEVVSDYRCLGIFHTRIFTIVYKWSNIVTRLQTHIDSRWLLIKVNLYEKRTGEVDVVI